MKKYIIMLIMLSILLVISASCSSKVSKSENSSETSAKIALFTQCLMDEISGTPEKPWNLKKIMLIACRNEFEPFSLGVRCNSDTDLSIEAGDLKGESGFIPSSEMEIALLEYGKIPIGNKEDWILSPGISRLNSGLF